MVTHLTDRQPAFERDIERRLWLAEQGLAEEMVLTDEEAAALRRREKGSATAAEIATVIQSFMQRVGKGIASLFPRKRGPRFVRVPMRPVATPEASPHP